MLLSDLLPLLYQNQLPMPLGGPAAALLPKSASNVTGGNIPGVKTPPLSSPTEMMNAGTAATSASYENRLRELQGFNLKQQTELMSQLPGALQRIMALQSGGGGDDTQAAGNQASGASGVTGARSLSGGVEDDGSAAALVKRHESGGDYNIGTGGSDLSKAKLDENGFPIWEGHNGSHAAGAYQFQPGTWAPYAKKLGIKDFSPTSQDAVFRAAYLDQGFKPWAPYNPKIAAALANGFKPNSVSGEETAPAGALGGGAGARMAQTLPPVPDFAGMMNGNQGSSYAPQTPQGNGMVAVRDVAGTYNVPQAEFDRAASSGTPYPGKPLQLAQNGPLSSLPTTQAPPMPMGAPSPPAVAPRMMPGGAATNPNPQMSPLQQAIVQFGVLSRMAKLGDVATPLEQAFYNSPQFKAAQAAASMGATKPIELQYAPLIAGETARGGAPFKSPVYEALAGAQQFPQGSPQRQTMETAASNSAGLKPVLGGERPDVPLLRLNPQTQQYEIVQPPGYAQASGDLSAARSRGTAQGKADVEYGDLLDKPLPGPAAPSRAMPGQQAEDAPVQSPRGTLIPPVSAQGVIPQNPAQLHESVPAWQKKTDEWTNAIEPARQAELRLGTIAQAFKLTESGSFETHKAELAAALKALGFDPSVASATDPTQVQLALHENYLQTLQRLKAVNGRFTQQEFKITSSNSEHPDLQPAANLQMLGEDMAILRHAQALPADWIQAQQMGWKNPQSFESAWTARNPLEKTVQQVKQEIGPLKGMPGANAAPDGSVARGPNGHMIEKANGVWIDQATRKPIAK